MNAEAEALIAFTCPRCTAAVHERFYGPCGACRDELGAQGGEARPVELEEYTPKVNVVANHVATKD